MKNTEVLDILQKLKLPLDKYILLREIQSIKLFSGREIFSDPNHTRISFGKDSFKIQYGHSEQYGSRISAQYYLSDDKTQVTFRVNDSNQLQLINNPGYLEPFRQPKFTDTLRVSIGPDRILSEAYIVDIKILAIQKSMIMKLSQPISKSGRFSFFDSNVYQNDGTCDHGQSIEGVYMKFTPNNESLSKKETVHEIIKYKDILEINLNIKNNKNFPIKDGGSSNDR